MNIKKIIEHLLKDEADRFILADAFAAIEPEIAPDATADEVMLAILSFAEGYLE